MLIGLHGKKQAGKDTVFERMRHILADVTVVERVSFADLLYQSAAASLGVSAEWLQRAKTNPYSVVEVWEGPDDPEATSVRTIREYLQAYGTEAHRQVFGEDFWVDQVRLAPHAGQVSVVTDVRFENEARAIIAANGVVVRVSGTPEIELAQDAHASEVPLADDLIYTTIYNDVRDDGFEYLDGRVNDLLRRILHDEVTATVEASA